MMKFHYKAKLMVAMIILIPALLVYAGGYYITDKDGKIIFEGSEKTINIGPTESTITFNDSGGKRVFDIRWHAEEKALVMKGDNVDLKVYSTGKIEKWKAINDDEKIQYPIIIEPVVPVFPKRKTQ